MKQCEGRTRPAGDSKAVRHRAGRVLCLGLVIACGVGARRFAAGLDQPVRPLSVRPRAMATGTRTVHAGDQLLDSFPDRRRLPDPTLPADYSVYVPRQCVGTRRCPLLVNLYQGGDWHPMADRYGLIVLFLPNTIGTEAPNDSISKIIDAALRQVLRTYAIDPDKIAMSGTCGSGGQAYFWGRSNLHVFSRVVEISPENHFAVPTPPQNPQTSRARFYLVAGVDEQTGAEHDAYSNYYLQNSLKAARELRRDGFRDGFDAGAPITAVLGIRDHVGRFEDYDYVGRWLHDSWPPAATPPPAPVVVADPLPLLTPEAVHRFTTFWTRFMQEPDTIREAGRLAHLRPIVIPVGTVRRASRMSDLGGLAARSPAVAADLKAAGLTARAAEAVRVALLSARATWSAGTEAGAVAANSVLGRNVTFLATHPSELKALNEEKMWRTP